MAWTFVLIAAALEVAWALGMKTTVGFTRLWPTVFTGMGLVASFGFLSLAVRTLPMGTAYAVWTGIGAAGTALFGIILFNEPRDVTRIVCIGLIVAGVVGLRLCHTG